MGQHDEMATAPTMQGGPSLPGSFGNGRYVPQKVLGIGGQKIVYLVEDTKLARRCALSFIADAAIEAAHRERFEREARAMARLGSHANVVAVFDIGEEDGRPFIVSELVSGGDLRAQLLGGPLSVERVFAVARDVLDALVFVHRHGLVHRDLKPDNIWLTEDGRAKLGDFGIALVADRPRLSVTGALLGTPGYMAPEQLQGERVDGRADLYSLGAMLHELVTGKPLYEGPLMAVLSQQLYAQPTPASEILPSVPRALEAFILRLLAKTPEARPASAEQARTELDRAGASGSVVPTPHDPLRTLFHAGFVGREKEIAALKAAFERALQGHPSLQLLVGDPGIGKTRLSQELALHARLRGARVLIGRCSEAEGAPPYLPFVDAIDPFLGAETIESLRARLGEDAVTLRDLFPRSITRLPEVPREGARAERHVLFQAMAGVLRGVAGSHGLALILEDLHWADKPSLLLLKHLVESLGDAPIVILATYRDVEVGRQHPLSAILTDLRRNPAVERVPLRGLGVESVNALLATVGDASVWSADFGAKLCARTDGNPLFVQEVLKQILASGDAAAVAGHSHELAIPEGIRDVIGQRLSKLGEECNRMLARASVIGASFSWDLLAAVADKPEDTLLDLLDEALASQVLREKKVKAGAIYEFCHALIRQTLYDEINAPRRARLHRQVGEAIERVHRSSLDTHVAELAHHFFQSNTAEKAVEYCIQAGDRAVAQVGYEEAVAHYGRALEMVDALDVDDAEKRDRRCELHARRGRALVLGPTFEGARGEIDQALALVRTDARRAELLVEHAVTSQFLFDIPQVGRDAEEVVRLAGSLGRIDLEAAGLAWRAVARVAEGDVAQSIRDFERSIEVGGIGEAQLVALAHHPLALYWAARYEEALEATTRILEVSRRANHSTSTTMTLPHRGLALACLGRYEEALATFREGRAFGERHGNRPLVGRILSMWAGTYLSLFDYEQAEVLAQEARVLGRAGTFMPPVISSGLDLAIIALRRGDLSGARARLEEVAKPAETAGAWHGWVWRMRLDELRAEIALRAGEPEVAMEAATRGLERATKSGRPRYRVFSRCLRGAALAALGRDASEDLDAALVDARAVGEKVVLLQAMRASLAVRRDDALLAEARELVRVIAASHPEETTRARFLERGSV
jgi:serine/threonine protein kinase/tetratricopeptide (TPR) repeat protein